MFDAQLLIADGGGSEVQVFGPWMTREGDDARLTLEIVDIYAGETTTLRVEVYQKNTEDTGDGTPYAGTSISATATGVAASVEWTGVKELVRYKFTYTGGLEGDGWVLFRMLDPVWFDAVAV